jgi:hypothetical protein
MPHGHTARSLASHLDAAGKAVPRDLISLQLRRGTRAGANGTGAAA